MVVSTNNKEINKNIGIYRKIYGKLTNIVDDIELSNYTVPSYIKREDYLLVYLQEEKVLHYHQK